DAHTSMVIGTMLKIKGHEKLETAGVRFIFQPAEEVGTGALSVADEGVIEGMDYFIGVHLRPEEEALSGVASPSIGHGAASSLELGNVEDDAHGARPHLNHNAIELDTNILNLLSQYHLNPAVTSSLKMTLFVPGGKSLAILSGSDEGDIDLRHQTNEQMDKRK